MNTMEKLNAKVLRLKARYTTSGQAMPSDDVLSLIDDLSVLIAALRGDNEEIEKRVLNLEGRVNHMNKVM